MRAAAADEAEGHEPAPLPAELDISVLVPVKDEAETVEELAARVAAVLTGLGRSFEIVFVDDGSRDGTPDRVREAHERDRAGQAGPAAAQLRQGGRPLRRLRPLARPPHPHHGRRPPGRPGRDPALPRPRSRRADLDLVSGWKRHRRDPATKRLPSLLFNWVTRQLAGVDLHDFNCGFKAYRREVLEQISVYGELHRYIPVLAEPPRLRRRRDRGQPPPAPPRRQQVRLGPPLQGAPRPHHGPLHHQATPAGRSTCSAPSGWSSWPAASASTSTSRSAGCSGEYLSNRPLLLLGVLLMLLGIQVLTTGLLGEMITFKNFRRRDSYSVKETVWR